MITFNFLIFGFLVFFNTQPASAWSGPLPILNNCVDQRGNFKDELIIEEVCRITNLERTKRKLKNLILDPELSEVAQQHAEDMARRGYFSHTSLDGKSPFDRISDARIHFRAAAENISKGYSSPAATLKGLMNSPGHRRNILGVPYQKIGVGFSENHWVQVFTD